MYSVDYTGARDVTAEARDQNVLRRPDPYLPVGGRAPQRGAGRERVVQVLVLGRPLLLPEPALREGLSDLRLATGARASLEDYGRGVALVLAALASQNVVAFPAFPDEPRVRGQGTKAIPL
jgi:hypothetical protein